MSSLSLLSQLLDVKRDREDFGIMIIMSLMTRMMMMMMMCWGLPRMLELTTYII